MKSEPELPQQQEQTQTIGDLIDLSDPVPQPPAKNSAVNDLANPPLAPLEKPKSEPEVNVRKQSDHEFAKSLPPSKLLNSVQEDSAQGASLRRTDSETELEDEFHDAHS